MLRQQKEVGRADQLGGDVAFRGLNFLGFLQPVVVEGQGDPAMTGGGGVGIIASISRPFCLWCNRLRLTCDGKLRNCLFALDEVDVPPLLRERPDDAHLAEVIRGNVAAKWEGHEINTAKFVKPARTMHAIGG
jgi:cyclic pyranopterin phosphate synthase